MLASLLSEHRPTASNHRMTGGSPVSAWSRNRSACAERGQLEGGELEGEMPLAKLIPRGAATITCDSCAFLGPAVIISRALASGQGEHRAKTPPIRFNFCIYIYIYMLTPPHWIYLSVLCMGSHTQNNHFPANRRRTNQPSKHEKSTWVRKQELRVVLSSSPFPCCFEMKEGKGGRQGDSRHPSHNQADM
jgi:hypothetical protein